MKYILLIGAILFVGCSDKKNETFQTVNYYNTHPKERTARLEECKTLSEMTHTLEKDCKNATASYRSTRPTKYSPSDF